MPSVIHWFRRDLRVADNTALHAACTHAGTNGHVIGVFIFDPKWWPADKQKLGPFQAKFWLKSLRELRQTLEARNVPLVFLRGDPVTQILKLARETKADLITLNKDYEPAQREMDDRLA